MYVYIILFLPIWALKLPIPTFSDAIQACMLCSLKPGLSILDFVSHASPKLWDKIWNGNPSFEANSEVAKATKDSSKKHGQYKKYHQLNQTQAGSLELLHVLLSSWRSLSLLYYFGNFSYCMSICINIFQHKKLTRRYEAIKVALHHIYKCM